MSSFCIRESKRCKVERRQRHTLRVMQPVLHRLPLLGAVRRGQLVSLVILVQEIFENDP